MSYTPFISVVIPTYNREDLIERAIRSILIQTYQDLEIIIVDDGSIDNTSIIVEDMVKNDRRIHYFRHESNRGAQAARITGISAAKGDFIAFLDSDDEWYPEKLVKEVKAFEGLPEKVGVVHSDCDVYYESTGEKKRFGVPKFSGYVYEELLRNPGPLYQCLMVRHKCFKEISDAIDPNVPSYQEWDTSINLAKKYDFYFIDEPLMVYNIHKGKTISKDFHMKIKGYLYIVEKHRQEILNYCGNEAMGFHYYNVALRYFDFHDNMHAKTFFKMAKKYGVRDLKDKMFIAFAAMNPVIAIKLLRGYIAAKKILF